MSFVRIIPARAGFTSGFAYSASGKDGGSSPLARGLRRRRMGSRKDRGIIPARAGFTMLRAWLSPSTWDHPRSRGVYGLTRL